MPELPEVETTVRGLRTRIIGSTVSTAWSCVPRLFTDTPSRRRFRLLSGWRITEVSRRAKYILIRLTKSALPDLLMAVHLRMTGHFLLGRWTFKNSLWHPTIPGPLFEKVNSYLRAVISFTDGTMLGLCDARKFARIQIAPATKIMQQAPFTSLGPDVFCDSVAPEALFQSARQRGVCVKQILLDQGFLAGIGNIYADEILWKSRIHPRTPAAIVTVSRWRRILENGNAILKSSIAVGGASLSDYRNVSGMRGGYTDIRLAYQRAGAPCLRCGTFISRIVIAGRSSHFCPRCQRLKLS